MKLSIIIPTFNRENILRLTISHVRSAIEGYDAEVIIVNDSNSKLNLTENEIFPATVIHNKGKGVASARNTGAKMAKNEILIFMDDDVLIFPDNIRVVLALHNQYKNSCFNLNWIYPPELTVKIKKTQFGRYLIRYGWTSLKGWHGNLTWRDNELFRSDLVASFFLSINRSDFFSINGYNEIFPLAGAEDYEFATRINESGITGYCYPLSMVYHNEADRVDPFPWLKRKENAAKTRKIAVGLGHKKVEVRNNLVRSILLHIGTKTLPLWYLIIHLIPNNSALDPLYDKIMNYLIATHIYKGYHKSGI